jgi:hypothetical protein
MGLSFSYQTYTVGLSNSLFLFYFTDFHIFRRTYDMSKIYTNPVDAFINELAWFVEDQALGTLHMNNNDLAARAHTTDKTISVYRSNIRNMQSGMHLPLPTWERVLVLAWAARPTPVTREFIQRLERLEKFYNAASVERPRVYGETGKIPVISSQLSPSTKPTQKTHKTVLSN